MPGTRHQAPGTKHILRIRATRFGRGTFVGKVADYLSFYVGVAWRLAWMKPRPERVVALTTPPYLSVLARLISKVRGADHAHWVMDLYPDVMVAHGMLKPHKMPHDALASLARWGMGGRRCASVLTLGPDMARRIGDLLGTTRDGLISWVPLWGEQDDEEPDGGAVAKRRQELGWQDDELVVMYSGNMGLGHRFGEILKVIGGDVRGQEAGIRDQRSEIGGQEAEVEDRTTDNRQPTTDKARARYVFFGGGKRRGEIAEFMVAHRGCAMELHDYVPREQLAVHLRSADVHLVSLETRWTGTMLPSKLQGIFAAGRPVVFIGDSHSSLAQWVLESGGGWVVSPGDFRKLAQVIDEARDPEIRRQRGNAALHYTKELFNRDINSRRIAERLSSEVSIG